MTTSRKLLGAAAVCLVLNLVLVFLPGQVFPAIGAVVLLITCALVIAAGITGIQARRS